MKDKKKTEYFKEAFVFYPCNICNKLHKIRGSFSQEYLIYLTREELDYNVEIRNNLFYYLQRHFIEEHPIDADLFDEELIIFVGIGEK